MQATLSFNLPEEAEEYKAALAGSAALTALHEIRQQVFRPARKHGFQDVKLAEALDRIDGSLNGAGTELIAELERVFGEILEEYDIPGDI